MLAKSGVECGCVGVQRTAPLTPARRVGLADVDWAISVGDRLVDVELARVVEGIHSRPGDYGFPADGVGQGALGDLLEVIGESGHQISVRERVVEFRAHAG